MSFRILRKMILLMLFLSGCGLFKPKMEISQKIIPFTTIAQSAPYGVAPVQPAYLVIRQADDWITVMEQLPNQAIATGLEVGVPAGQIILVAYAGVQPSGGYRIEIQSVMQQNDSIIVIVTTSPPEPSEITVPSESLPFHIISIAAESAESWDGYTLIFQDDREDILKQIILP